MANTKISQLPNAVVPLQDTDLIAVVQGIDTEPITNKVKVGDLKQAIASTSNLLYPDGKKAIEASETELSIYDKNETLVAEISPTLFKIEHGQADIQLHTQKNQQYLSDLALTDIGLRFTRVEKNGVGAVIRASQLRLNSADGYFNAKENIEIAAGTLNNDSVLFDNLSGGTLRLMSGGKVEIKAKGAMDIIASATILVNTPSKVEIDSNGLDINSNANINVITATDLVCNTKNIKIDTVGQININNTNSGTIIKTTGTSGSNSYENTASIKKDGIKLITKTNGTITNQLSFSNSAATITSTKITLETDSFVIKDRNGNLMYDNSTIATLISEIASLKARVTALES